MPLLKRYQTTITPAAYKDDNTILCGAYSINLQIEVHVNPLQLNKETLDKLQSVFENEMELGIRGSPSSLQMENTYIPELPDGTGKIGCDRGISLQLFTNFKPLSIRLGGFEDSVKNVSHTDFPFNFCTIFFSPIFLRFSLFPNM